MKKTLLALAVGAALAPAAHADVVLTGVLNVGPTIHSTNSGSVSKSNSITSTGPTAVGGGTTAGLSRNYSWLGVGSTEDLGGGLKLDAFLQFQMEPEKAGTGNSNASGITNRNSRIGFTGESWGGVWVGSNENIYERYLYSTDPIDGAMGVGGNLSIFGSPGYGVVFDQPTGKQVVGQAGFYRRTEHTIWYDSPNWNGFTFGAAWMMPFEKVKLSDVNVAVPSTLTGGLTGVTASLCTLASCVNPGSNITPSIWSLGAKYVGPSIPLELWLAYERHKEMYGMFAIQGIGVANQIGTGSTDQGIQAGVAYTFGDIRVFGLFEQLKYKQEGLTVDMQLTEYKRNAFGLGLKWNVASGYVGAQWLKANDASCKFSVSACNANDTGASLYTVGYFHNLSKQTQVYGVVAYIDNKDLASYSPAGGLGVFGGAVSPGQNIFSGTVGIKHSF
jgi:predicted porin